MPARLLVAKKISSLLGVLAHPQRIRLIEELALGSKDVRSIEAAISIPQSSVSQHLSLLKALGLVQGDRVGKHVVYSLTKTWIASWLLEAVRLIDEEDQESKQLRIAANQVKKVWKGAPRGRS